MTIVVVLGIAIAFFSIYAGTHLWQKKPGAVTLTKRFLCAFLAYNIFTIIVMARFEMFEGSVELARSITYVVVWYTYLSISKG